MMDDQNPKPLRLSNFSCATVLSAIPRGRTHQKSGMTFRRGLRCPDNTKMIMNSGCEVLFKVMTAVMMVMMMAMKLVVVGGDGGDGGDAGGGSALCGIRSRVV